MSRSENLDRIRLYFSTLVIYLFVYSIYLLCFLSEFFFDI